VRTAAWRTSYGDCYNTRLLRKVSWAADLLPCFAAGIRMHNLQRIQTENQSHNEAYSSTMTTGSGRQANSREFPATNAARLRQAETQTDVTSTCPKEAQEGTPTRRQVERSCEVIYASQSVSWASWRPLRALWLECLSSTTCAAARMCRRQRQRAWAALRARMAVRAARDPRLGA